jgi:hypothetical protein
MAPPVSGAVYVSHEPGGYLFFTSRTIHFSSIDTEKLTTAPIPANTTVLNISPVLMFTSKMVKNPPNVPAFVAGVIYESLIQVHLKIRNCITRRSPSQWPGHCKHRSSTGI